MTGGVLTQFYDPYSIGAFFMLQQNTNDHQGRIAPVGGDGKLQAVKTLLQQTIERPIQEPKHDDASVNLDVRFLPLDGFNSIIQDYITTTADAIGCDPSSVALSCLTSAATTISGKRTARLLNKARTKVKLPCIVPNVFGCIVARAGVGKTPAIKIPLAPLESIDQDLKREYVNALSSYHPTKENNSAPPKRRKRILGNATIEGIVSVAQNNSDDLGNMELPVYMVLDELGGFFKNISSSKFSDGKDFFCNAFDGHGTSIVRKTDGITDFTNLKVSFIGGIQPELLRTRIAADPDLVHQGFLHRFLWVFDESKIQDTSDKGTDDGLTAYWDDLLQELNRLTPVQLEFTADATALYWRWYSNFVKFANAQDDGRVNTLFSKQQQQLARIALLFATLHKQDVIEYDDVKCAIRMCNYFLYTSLTLFDFIETGEIVAKHDTPEIVNDVLNRVFTKERLKELSLSEISQFFGRQRDFVTKNVQRYKTQHGISDDDTKDKSKKGV